MNVRQMPITLLSQVMVVLLILTQYDVGTFQKMHDLDNILNKQTLQVTWWVRVRIKITKLQLRIGGYLEDRYINSSIRIRKLKITHMSWWATPWYMISEWINHIEDVNQQL